MRIAHVSDLHVLSPSGVRLRSVLFNKRLTGYANLLMHRNRSFRRQHLLTVLERAASAADHLVVTGDITNLSLESEYEEATRILGELRRSVEVTVIPGNHDIYLPRIHREGRFAHHFHSFCQGDLPELGVDVPAGRYPFVKLRGTVAIIGLSSAVPRPPFVSAGVVGQAQLSALARLLEHPEVARRTPVILVHHDPLSSRFQPHELTTGLVDARALRRTLQPLTRGLVLFGHLHVRGRASLPTAGGALDVVVSSGAALDHPADRVRAGYHLYEVDDRGAIAAVEAWVLDASGTSFHAAPLGPWRGAS